MLGDNKSKYLKGSWFLYAIYRSRGVKKSIKEFFYLESEETEKKTVY
jgi:hypothetical protein